MSFKASAPFYHNYIFASVISTSVLSMQLLLKCVSFENSQTNVTTRRTEAKTHCCSAFNLSQFAYIHIFGVCCFIISKCFFVLGFFILSPFCDFPTLVFVWF